MKEPKARVLVVDDYEPWRRFVSSTFEKHPEFLIVGEVADGLPALEKAQELHPDLILLDIGLPTLNGIEAARRIRKIAPKSKILFISENRSWDIAKEALRTGAGGYLVKSDAASELLPAIGAVLQGKRFISASLAGNDLGVLAERHAGDAGQAEGRNIGRHEVCLYSDDGSLLNQVAKFLGAALKAGHAAVVVATEPHREHLVPKLQAQGVDMEAAIQQGRYIALDAAKTVSTFMVHGMLDRARFLKAWGDLILRAAQASKEEHPHVAAYGGGAGLLWAQGNIETAIEIEKVCNQLINSYDVDILCGYSLTNVEGGMQSLSFQRVCAEHSAVLSC